MDTKKIEAQLEELVELKKQEMVERKKANELKALEIEIQNYRLGRKINKIMRK